MAYNSIHRRIKQWKEPAYDESNKTINQYESCIISISFGKYKYDRYDKS